VLRDSLSRTAHPYGTPVSSNEGAFKHSRIDVASKKTRQVTVSQSFQSKPPCNALQMCCLPHGHRLP